MAATDTGQAAPKLADGGCLLELLIFEADDASQPYMPETSSLQHMSETCFWEYRLGTHHKQTVRVQVLLFETRRATAETINLNVVV